MDTKPTTGERMKLRRKELGLSAEHVADLLGVSPATIYRYENGDIDKVPGERLAPIAKALNTTPAYLIGWDDSASFVAKEMLAAPEGAELSAAKQAFIQKLSQIEDADVEMLNGILDSILAWRAQETP